MNEKKEAKEISKVNFPCDITWFKVPCLFQEIVYEAFWAHGLRLVIIDAVKRVLMNAFREKKFLHNEPEQCFQIVFDESIWPSEDKTSYRNIMVIKLNHIPNAGAQFILELDFRKNIREGVSFNNEGNKININVFDVVFEDGE